MNRVVSTHRAGQPELLANGYDLERQLRVAERHYAQAQRDFDRARDEWRALTTQPAAPPELLYAARAKLQAVTARCRRLLETINELEERLDV